MEIQLKPKAVHLEQTLGYEQRQKYKLGVNCNKSKNFIDISKKRSTRKL